MKFASVVLVLTLAVATISQVNSLKCYVCQGTACNDLTDDKLIECDSLTTPTTEAPTTEPPATADPSDSTTAGSSDTTPETSPGTSPEPTSEPTTEAAAETSPPTPQPGRVFEQALGGRDSKLKSSAAALLIRNYRSIQARADGDAKRCFDIYKKNGNEASINHRGCVTVPAAKDACDAVNDFLNLTADNVEHCRTCETDGCNSSGALKISVVAFLAIFIVKGLM